MADEERARNEAADDNPESHETPARRRAFLKLAVGAAGAGVVAGATGRPAAAVGGETIDGGSASLRDDSIQARRGTQLDWETLDPELEPGELGIETDTGRLKLGKHVAANWSELPYVTDERFDDQVLIDGLPLAEFLEGTETVLGWQPAAPTPEVQIPLVELGRFEAQRLASYNADFVWDPEEGRNFIVAFGSGAFKMYLPEAFPALYPEPQGAMSAAHLTLIQSETGKVEFSRELVGGSPNPNVFIKSYALTAAAAANPTNPPTRLRTRGQWAVARLVSVPNILGVTVWVVSGDVEAF